MSAQEWIIASAEVGSAIGTVGALSVSYRLLRREAHRDAAREERLHRERAGYLNAWVERDPELDPDETAFPPRVLRFIARNDGSLPVYSIVLLAPDFYQPDGRLVLTNLDLGMLAPGHTCTSPAPEQMNANFTAPSPIPVIFTDSSGERWWRNGDGLLAEYHADQGKLDLDDFLIAWQTSPEIIHQLDGTVHTEVINPASSAWPLASHSPDSSAICAEDG